MSDLVRIEDRRWRKEVPKEHKTSIDTRLVWLWHQRFGTLQMVYNNSTDLLDRTAATLILQAVMMRDLVSIQQLFNRLEGAAVYEGEEEGEAFRI